MIHLITGGERSGKSSFTQQLALEMCHNPLYMATAKVWDADFEKRILRHQTERDSRWESVELETALADGLPTDNTRVVVIDCVTLWLTNFFSIYKNDKDKSLDAAKNEFNKLNKYQGWLLIVTNEIGMGVHGADKITRDFVELQGWMNQYIANYAERVTLMVSGIPLRVK